MTFGSLFSGIGGMDLGLERSGMTCQWQVEIDDYATRVLEKHWPNISRWRDVWDFIADAKSAFDWQCASQSAKRQGKEFGESTFRTDLVCGGFPCQPVSLAGRRAGDRDERWLWPAFRGVLEIIRPDYVLVENVPGLVTANAGRLFRGILGDLWSLGYNAEWQTLPAAAFGAPHLRERVFIVGTRYVAHEIVAYCNQQRLEGTEPKRKRISQLQGTANVGEFANANANESRLPQWESQRGDTCTQQPPLVGTDWRSVKPTIRRGDDGASAFVDRVARLRCLGNAVVPQVAEWIGRQILNYEKGLKWPKSRG